ncbi:hypothetical protein IWX90DRAFT_231929 [Phyllosticta citrichinensis]|uniref:Secreted protein n=1 Tax=Phyllosticta citrichinensis TaxID=1130410 RepID=A0ABR1XUP1_9PEZI
MVLAVPVAAAAAAAAASAWHGSAWRGRRAWPENGVGRNKTTIKVVANLHTSTTPRMRPISRLGAADWMMHATDSTTRTRPTTTIHSGGGRVGGFFLDGTAPHRTAAQLGPVVVRRFGGGGGLLVGWLVGSSKQASVRACRRTSADMHAMGWDESRPDMHTKIGSTRRFALHTMYSHEANKCR